MSITSLIFLFVFLPLSLLLYYISSERAREYVLLFISLLFYALGSLKYILLFIAEIAVTVLLGRAMYYCKIKRVKRGILLLGIFANVSLLLYYKYSGFASSVFGSISDTQLHLEETALPLGISFFTFKAISYLADIYKNKAELEKNPIHDALYLSFFSQVQSGPLSRYNEMKLYRGRNLNAAVFSEGVSRFITGFCKKILLANVLANITGEIFAAPMESCSTSYVWLGAICYSMQLFLDFSGYSDMAIGLSAMFGYHCMENFNYPYMTESVSGFWRRWHISLSQWFRDYIYIPLGGSKTKNSLKKYGNLFLVWILTGVWHGAAWNFIAWGLGYFVAIAFEKRTKLPQRLKSPAARSFYRIPVLLFIQFQWVLFNSENLKSGLLFIGKMIFYQANSLADSRTAFLIKDYAFFIVAALILCFPILPLLEKRVANRKKLSAGIEIGKAILLLIAFVWAISFVVAGQNNPFAYANF